MMMNEFTSEVMKPTNRRTVKSGYLPDNEDFTYRNEMLKYMKYTELKTRYNRDRLSPQVSWRRHLVDWTCTVAEKLGVGRCAIHLAIKLLDNFMGGHDIEERRLHFVSIGCLRIATKFEEKDSRVPKLKAISALLPENRQNGFRKSEYVALEEMILKSFEWNVYMPTANHFVDMLMTLCISGTDLYLGIPVSSNFEEAERRFKDFLYYFLDVSLQEVDLVTKLPSRVAAAVVFCSREAYQLTPIWPLELEITSGLCPSEFTDCATILTNVYKNALRLDANGSVRSQAKRSYDECYKQATPNKRRKLCAEDNKVKYQMVPNNVTPVSDEDTSLSGRIPMIDLSNNSSNLIEEKIIEVPVIDISPDDGYSSMTCSSAEYYRNDGLNQTDAESMSIELNEHSEEDTERKSAVEDAPIDGPFYGFNDPNSQHFSGDRWDLKQNSTFKQYHPVRIATDVNLSHVFPKQPLYQNCKRNLNFGNFKGEESANQDMTQRTEFADATVNMKRSSANIYRNNCLLYQDISDDDIIIIEEKFPNVNKFSSTNQIRTYE